MALDIKNNFLPDSVISKYAPLVCLHPEEKYFPCSTDWLLRHSTFHYTQNGQPQQTFIIKDEELLHVQNSANVTDMHLMIHENAFQGQRTATETGDVPMYAVVRKVVDIATDSFLFWEVTYLFLYAFNKEGGWRSSACAPS